MENKILAIDLGTTAGWAFLDSVGIESGWWTTKASYLTWYNEFKKVLDKFMPDIIVCSQTNSYGHFNASKKMFMFYGIVCLTAEKLGIGVIELNDRQARKNLLGNGGLKKEEAKLRLWEMFPEHVNKQADECDAIVIALGWKKMNEES